MEAATTVQAPVEATGEAVKFYSRSREYRAWRVQRVERQVIAGGAYEPTEPGLSYYFGPHGQLEVREGQDVIDGIDAPTWLRQHTDFNSVFFEEGKEPGRLLPTEEDQIERVLAAVRDLNRAEVEAVQAEEKMSHNRNVVLDTCARALAMLEEQGVVPAEPAAESEVVEGEPEQEASPHQRAVGLALLYGVEPPEEADVEKFLADVEAGLLGPLPEEPAE